MPSAIVTGATGILGREIVHELGREPNQWTSVHALSRSKKEDYPSNVVHNHIDLQASAEDMAKELKDVEAEYVFFAAYLAKDDELESWWVNGDMLSNFLDALVITGASKKLKRIILVTGAKQYGVHLGRPKNPMLESDDWLESWEPKDRSDTVPKESSNRPPNFYYNQQNILKRFCEKNSVEWVVTYPNDVIGYAVGNFMNLGTALGLYASISKELGGDLVFPGSQDFYTRFDCFTSSKLHAQFCAWAALEPRAANEAFNVVNGDVESWQNLWPQLAAHFGTKVAPEQFAKPSSNGSEVTLADPPPLGQDAEKRGLVGTPDVSTPSKVVSRIDLVKWNQRKDVKDAWARLVKRDGLQEDTFEKATWGFLVFILGREFDMVISMSKARKLGWTGYVDTWESLEGMWRELEKAKMLPVLSRT